MPIHPVSSATLRKPSSVAAPVQEQPTQFDIEQVLGEIAQYKELGKVLKREALQNVGTRLAAIAEMAEQAVVNEADDWFDAHTVSRNMKEIKTYAKDFMKLAEEADTINQRMTALYDDMGRVLERYFEIPDLMDPAEVPDEQKPEDGIQLQEDHEEEEEGEIMPSMAVPAPAGIQQPDPKLYHATPVPEPTSNKIDVLTLRAIQLVHKRLKQKNPEMARRFAAIPAKKMKEVIWTLV